jgi:lysine 2,3-aminomutase
MYFTEKDYQKQIAEKIVSLDQLKSYIELPDDTIFAVKKIKKQFKWGTTPYYASLMDAKNESCPIRRQALPSVNELEDDPALCDYDPLKEGENSPIEGLVQVYNDRVALCVSDSCASYCRFCFRKYYFKKKKSAFDTIDSGIEFIKKNKKVRDVLITGGDPFLLDEGYLESILIRLREIKHVEIIRIGTRLLCTLPQRFTPELAQMLEKYHPLFVNVQFNHPKEITKEVFTAASTLLKAGIPLQNQSVLLKGVNDSADVMKSLVQRLVRARIIPYYLFQCQLVTGTKHFRVRLEDGIELMRILRGHTTGFAIPLYVLDTPYGKVPLCYNRFVKRNNDYVLLETYTGKIWHEYNPMRASTLLDPL